MARNIIFYGPPGTGKTFLLQRLMNDYVDYSFDDQQIKDAFTRRSDHWMLVSLIMMQAKRKMKPSEIQEKIRQLALGIAVNVSTVLETHNTAASTLGVHRLAPRIFFEYSPGEWYVDLTRLIQYDVKFFEKYLPRCSVERRYAFVTFHQSFSYEDFIEGIRPTYDAETKAIDYSPKPGVLKTICDIARRHPEKEYAVFIDEINRGNISEIFGELISLIELDKREGTTSELSVILPYSKETFTIPSNLSFYGSMNSADKSIAAIDLALRRRFKFTPLAPDSAVLLSELEIAGVDARNLDGIDLIKLFDTINARIEILLDSNHTIGHAFFLKCRSYSDIANVIATNIVPLLEEYFFDDLQKIQLILNDLNSDGDQKSTAIYKHKELRVETYFDYVGEYLLDDCRQYYLSNNITQESLKQIYEGV